jgi:hypothetical protein
VENWDFARFWGFFLPSRALKGHTAIGWLLGYSPGMMKKFELQV